MIVALLPPPTALGLSSAQRNLYNSGIYTFDIATDQATNAACGGSASATVSGSNNAEMIWNYLTGTRQLTPIAAAGIMGNFSQESGLDPAIKQNKTTRAIPDGGDGKTGFGLAQWTTPPQRQAGLFTKMREAGLQQYYGAGWGNPEKDKDMPIEDIKKLITIELDYAWEGDTTKIKDIAEQLKAAPSEKGDNGSTVLFHKLFERSADGAAQIQQRVTDASGFLQKYGGTTGTTSCAGELGGVTKTEDAIPWAMKFIEDTKAKYDGAAPATATQLPNPKTTPNGSGSIMNLATFPESTSFICWGAYGCDECVTLSGWFVTNMTGYTFGGGNGGDVVGNLKAKGVSTGSDPRPFSVFSYDTGSFGHTGVVLGVLGDGTAITLEDNWVSNTVSIRQYDIKKSYPNATFAYVADKLKVTGIDPTTAP